MSLIVTFFGGIAQYLIEDKSWFAEVSDYCPLCGLKTHRHGHYKRTIWLEQGSASLRIFRRYCPHCRHSFSYLPSFIKRYARFPNSYRLNRIQRHVLDNISIQKVIQPINPLATSISVTTFRRWIKKLRLIAVEVTKLLMQRLLELKPNLSPPSGRLTDLMLLLQSALKFHDRFCEISRVPPNVLGVFDVLNLELQSSFQI